MSCGSWWNYDMRLWDNAHRQTSVVTLSLPTPSDADREERKRLAMLADVKRTVLGPKRSRWNT